MGTFRDALHYAKANRLYARLLRHSAGQKISQVKLETVIRPYCVRTPMPHYATAVSHWQPLEHKTRHSCD